MVFFDKSAKISSLIFKNHFVFSENVKIFFCEIYYKKKNKELLVKLDSKKESIDNKYIQVILKEI